MKNYKKGFVGTILLIIVVLAIIIAGYIYFVKAPVSNKTGNTAATSTPVTTSLKTYTNTQYGFMVQYPTDTKGLDVEKIFSKVTVATMSSEYDNCSTVIAGYNGATPVYAKMINARGVSFCPIRKGDNAMGQTHVDNKYITKKDGKYYTVYLSGDFRSKGSCAGVENCVGYEDINRMFEEQILPTVTFN